MKAKLPAIHILAVCTLPLAITSCGTMKVVTAAKDKTSSAVGKLADASGKFADASIGRFTGPKIPVVEVREKDLRDLPSGDQQVASLEAKKKRSFWFFGGPVDFKEAPLPTAAGEMDGSLLPPIE